MWSIKRECHNRVDFQRCDEEGEECDEMGNKTDKNKLWSFRSSCPFNTNLMDSQLMPWQLKHLGVDRAFKSTFITHDETVVDVINL